MAVCCNRMSGGGCVACVAVSEYGGGDASHVSRAGVLWDVVRGVVGAVGGGGMCEWNAKWWLYSQGGTALFDASYGGHPEVVALLLDRGAALDHTDRWGHSTHICNQTHCSACPSCAASESV